MIYRTTPFSVTLNDPYPHFQGHAIFWHWICRKQYDIQTQCQWNTNSDLHTPYATVSFRMTLSDLAKYSMTWSVVRSLCDSWASCYICYNVVVFHTFYISSVALILRFLPTLFYYNTLLTLLLRRYFLLAALMALNSLTGMCLNHLRTH